MNHPKLKSTRKGFAIAAKCLRVDAQASLNLARHLNKHTNQDPQPSYAAYLNAHHSRVNVVRPQARVHHLAHSYLTGRNYNEVEQDGNFNDFNMLCGVLNKYLEQPITVEEVRVWVRGV